MKNCWALLGVGQKDRVQIVWTLQRLRSNLPKARKRLVWDKVCVLPEEQAEREETVRQYRDNPNFDGVHLRVVRKTVLTVEHVEDLFEYKPTSS